MTQLHLESYWLSVKHSAPEGTKEYAQSTPTKNPTKYPTVYDYLLAAVGNARAALEDGDLYQYQYWINQHRLVAIKLNERRVQDLVGSYGPPDELLVFDFIKEKGWKWFKFYNKALTMNFTGEGGATYLMAWIPRYLPEFGKFFKEGGYLCFDADELDYIWNLNNPEIMEKILHTKKQSFGMKLVDSDDGMFFKPVEQFNLPTGPKEQERVRDWSLPLF